jgi:hypothetical protein
MKIEDIFILDAEAFMASLKLTMIHIDWTIFEEYTGMKRPTIRNVLYNKTATSKGGMYLIIKILFEHIIDSNFSLANEFYEKYNKLKQNEYSTLTDYNIILDVIIYGRV